MGNLVNIVVNGSTVSIGDWSRAKRATADQLPKLSGAQMQAARKLGISEDEYARSVLAQKYGEERMHHRAKKFIAALHQTLQAGNIAGQVVKLERRPNEDVWFVDIGTESEAVRMKVSLELFDDILDDPGDNASYTQYLQVKLKSLVRESFHLGDVA